MWDKSGQLVLVDQVEDLVQVTTFISHVAFAEDADRADEETREGGDDTLQSSLADGVPTEREKRLAPVLTRQTNRLYSIRI